MALQDRVVSGAMTLWTADGGTTNTVGTLSRAELRARWTMVGEPGLTDTARGRFKQRLEVDITVEHLPENISAVRTSAFIAQFMAADLLNFSLDPGDGSTPIVGTCQCSEMGWMANVDQLQKVPATFEVFGVPTGMGFS